MFEIIRLVKSFEYGILCKTTQFLDHLIKIVFVLVLGLQSHELVKNFDVIFVGFLGLIDFYFGPDLMSIYGFLKYSYVPV